MTTSRSLVVFLQVHCVKALVSVMGGAVQEEIKRSMQVMEKNIDEKIEVNRKKAKKRKYDGSLHVYS